MEQFYQEEFTLTDLYVDRFGRLKPSALLFLNQEVSGTHAAMLGTSWEELNEKDLFWAVIRQKVSVTRLPCRGEKITLQTWPMPTTRSYYPRAVLALDRAGRELYRSVTMWVLMNTQTRSMVLPGKSGVTVNGFLRDLEGPLPTSIHPTELPSQIRRAVSFTDLDRNGHMNNTRYLDWICDLPDSSLHRDRPFKSMNVCYLSEAQEGQELTLAWGQEEGGLIHAEALRRRTDVPEKQERIFAAELVF